jgi:hypothetical protein
LEPTQCIIYLGLDINVQSQQMHLSAPCIQYLQDPLALVPAASYQDLQGITWHATWLCWAVSWSIFAATKHMQQRDYWLWWITHKGLYIFLHTTVTALFHDCLHWCHTNIISSQSEDPLVWFYLDEKSLPLQKW